MPLRTPARQITDDTDPSLLTRPVPLPAPPSVSNDIAAVTAEKEVEPLPAASVARHQLLASLAYC